MFFTISKIVAYFFSPLFWVLLLILLALLFRKRRAGLRFLVASLVVFYLFSNRFLVDEALRAWEMPLTEQSSLDTPYDAAVILGGGVTVYDRTADRLIFREAADKMLQAIDLYRNGRVKYILVSGGAGNLFLRDQLEASLMKRYLIKIGIPDSVILVDSLSDNTHENALFSAQILKQKFPDGHFLLVTTALHMRRAMGCFRKEGLEVTPYTTNKITGTRRTDPEHLFIPQTESFIHWRNWLHEIIGYGVYRINGYL